MSEPLLIQVPYHLGRRDEVLGRGVPVLAEALGAESVVVERPGEFGNEIAASLDVARAVADAVRDVVAGGGFPVVLAGNCSSSLGTVTGLGSGDGLGVVWFDAHADFNTPETTPTGFFDGMCLALLTGSGWAGLRNGLAVVPEERVALVGARDLDPAERERLERSRIRSDPEQLQTSDLYLHVDLDVLDPSVGRANAWAADGGLRLEELEDAIDRIGGRFRLRAAALTAYDPDCDAERAIPAAARRIFERIVAAAA